MWSKYHVLRLIFGFFCFSLCWKCSLPYIDERNFFERHVNSLVNVDKDEQEVHEWASVVWTFGCKTTWAFYLLTR